MGVVSSAIDPAGNPVLLEDHQVTDAAAAGYKPISRTEASQLAQAQEDQRYVDENWGTAGKALAGAASGLSLGLAPALAARAGLVDRGHLEAAEQSGAYTAGDIAGTLAPAFLSGGESVVARGLAATPIGLVGRAGGAAERLVSRFLPESGILGAAARGTISMAARGATEGALINAAHQASQDIIQNKPLAAQSLLAAGAEGALFGGLTGGVLGGVSSLASLGIDAVGGKVASTAASTGDEAAAKALKYLGANDTNLAELSSREAADTGFAQRRGALPGAVKDYYKIIQEGDASLLNHPDQIHAAVEGMSAKYAATASAAIADLQRDAAAQTPSVQRVTDRIKQDLGAAFSGTLDARQVSREFVGLRKELSGIKSWDNWATSREQLADRVSNSTGLRHEINKVALNAFDGELRTAMEAADPAIAKTFGAAVSQQKLADELSAMTKRAVGQKAGQKSLTHLDNSDAATIGFSVFTGADPLVAGGILAGKKIAQHVQRKLEPVIAEYAARSVVGAEAGHAQAQLGTRISGAFRSFMNGGRTYAINEESRGSYKKPDYTVGNYHDQLALADQLTSADHQQRVRETMEALATMGHPELAQEMADTYGRAVAYVQKNRPKGVGKEASFGNLTRPAKDAGLNTAAGKFIRQLSAIRDPVGTIVAGLQDGDLSRDAVAAIKYVMPDVHQEIVLRASQEILSMKQEGKYLPADKVALLGVALDAPVDSKLSPEYIAEVQKGLSANKAPPPGGPGGGNSPPPVADTSAYQTPMQSSVS